ncbi:FAD-dependent oxidoreductase [Paracoccus sp. (in: a-proteobacteria)]|uniref:FAD-dependent oxidoreductase n=1 Tax=Paracoccus sp. TaxID=267 RepID=UPI00321FF386
MSNPASDDAGPDLTQGVTLEDFGGKPMLRGHVGDQPVLLARVGNEILAVGAECTHYHAMLDQGLLQGDTVRCPMHHACFSLRSGEAIAAPAFDALPCWQVRHEGGRILVTDRITPAPRQEPADTAAHPREIVIIGGGAAGFACAEMLRRRGYGGRLTMLSAETDPPCDRPNLSKDYLAGNAPDDWMPLKSAEFYAGAGIELRLGTTVASIDAAARRVTLASGESLGYDRLLIATGAEPVRVPMPGAEQPHVFVLRSYDDSRAISARAADARHAVVLGSGFIGLEVAAALRNRGLQVQVVSLDARPLERVLGPELGDFIRSLHEGRGVQFHMGNSIAGIGADSVTLKDGQVLAADLVVIGIGVRPRQALAEAAGLATDRGILVNAQLETSQPGILAAGDVARWPGGPGGQGLRVEHWVVAERQGQVAAENMLGAGKPFRDVPFFWSEHYDVAIRYVGHAEGWDSIEIDGDIAARDASIAYRRDGRIIALATIGRDGAALAQGQAMDEDLARA